MTHVRPRWAILPLTLSLLVAALGARPAAADNAATDYRGYLLDSAEGTRYVVDDVGGSRVYTSPAGAVDGALGGVTPAGVSVVYVSEIESGTSYLDRVHVVTPDGADTVVYTAAPNTHVTEPALSLHEDRAVFALDDDTTNSVVTVDVVTQSARVLRRSTTTTYSGPTFSPDGRYLAWVQSAKAKWAVVTVDARTGGDETELLSSSYNLGWVDDAAWSPDGTRLATVYTQYLADGGQTVTGIHILSVTSGTNVAVAASGSLADGVATSYVEPTWSSNSDLLVSKIRETASSFTAALVQVPADGGVERDVVLNDSYAGSPSAPRQLLVGDTTPPDFPFLSDATVLGAAVQISPSYSNYGANSDVADMIVTRVVGSAADTPTASIIVSQERGSLLVPLPAPDTDYGISVFARDWSGNVSRAATTWDWAGNPVRAAVVQVHSPPRPVVTLGSLPTKVVQGAAVRMTGTVSSGSAGLPVSLWVRRGGTATPTMIRTAVTDAHGAFTFTCTPQWSAEYQVRTGGSKVDFPSTSAKRIVSVTPRVSAVLSASRTAVGRAVTLAGGVAPSHAGQSVSIQRYVGGAWRTLATARLSSTSQYRYSLKPSSRGTWTLRVVKPADSDHLLAVSPSRSLSIR